MTLRRFCALCNTQINEEEIYFDVTVTPKKGLNEERKEEDAYYEDFCYNCTSGGKALAQLMKQRSADFLKEKQKKADANTK